MKRTPPTKDERNERIRKIKEARAAFAKQCSIEAGQYWGGVGAKQVAAINRRASPEKR